METPSSSESWLDERYRESLDLAENVFDSLRNSGTGTRQCQVGPGDKCCRQFEDGCGDVVLASELARVLGALRDCADGAGGFVPVESTPNPTPLAGRPGVDRNTWCQEVSREEFLKALREAFGIVGRRAFDSVLRAQLRLLAQERQAHDDSHSERSYMDTTRASDMPPSTTSGSDSGKTPMTWGNGRRQPPQLSYGGDWTASAAQEEARVGCGKHLGDQQASPTAKGLPMITPTPSSSLASAKEAEWQGGCASPEPWELFPLTRQQSSPAASGQDRQTVREQVRGEIAQMSAISLNYEGLFTGSAPSSPTGRQASEPSCSPRGRRRSSSVACAAVHGLPSIRGAVGQSPAASTDCSGVNSAAQVSPAISRQLSPGEEAASVLSRQVSPATAQLGIIRKSLEDITIDPSIELKDPQWVSPAASLLSHFDRWNLPQETLIFFDWDDTLCPTTWIHEDSRLTWCQAAPCFADPTVPLADPSASWRSRLSSSTSPSGQSADAATDQSVTMLDCLQRHAAAVLSSLRTASACGQVVIVTLGKQGWVELSIENFMPGLLKELEELGVEIVYAREALPRWKIRSASLDDMNIFQLMKQEAFRDSMKKFYRSSSSAPGRRKRHQRAWKNVLCVGDSATERDAVTEVIFCHSQLDKSGSEIPCRCKTVKLPEDPDLQQLTTELELLTSWLEALAQFDGDIELDLSNSEETMMLLEKVLQAAPSGISEVTETASPRNGLLTQESDGLAIQT